MSSLDALKNASNLREFATAIGYRPQGLAYILYKIPDASKYTTFEIPKRSGGLRQIAAPTWQLKALQRRLADVLYECRDEIDAAAKRKSLSHGFRRKHSIITNAARHKGRRFVFNLDIEDYFPSFNFGRVRGFFIRNRHFGLHPSAATLIAQIACFENRLPQGSPCSPVIADLISHLLDVKLAQLAKQHGATYSRYADDLTFSTRKKDFPGAVATTANAGVDWEIGNRLISAITEAGFRINANKTRMQLSTSRQLVTGLTVNAKVNITSTYYRRARHMCHSLFRRGLYYDKDELAAEFGPEVITDLAPLEGILSHIHHVKDAVDRRDAKAKVTEATAARRLYKSFLSYRHFVRLERPLVVCEGKTDNVYLKCAIRRLPAFHPTLGSMVDGTFVSAVAFFNYLNQSHKILQLSGGSDLLKNFAIHYQTMLKDFRHRPLLHPVVLLVDNDEGAKDLFPAMRSKFKTTISRDTTDAFYHLTDNLYLVKMVEKGGGATSCIEDCFTPQLLATQLDGKKFNPEKDFGSDGEYGKHVFSEKVVRAQANTVDFSGFVPLLQRLVAAIDDYAVRRN